MQMDLYNFYSPFVSLPAMTLPRHEAVWGLPLTGDSGIWLGLDSGSDLTRETDLLGLNVTKRTSGGKVTRPDLLSGNHADTAVTLILVYGKSYKLLLKIYNRLVIQHLVIYSHVQLVPLCVKFCTTRTHIFYTLAYILYTVFYSNHS